MTDCFVCEKHIRIMGTTWKAKQLNEFKIDIPIGFTDSDLICHNCKISLMKERDILRTQGNCFFCKKTLGIHDDKFFKEELGDYPENFTFCDIVCEECVEKGDRKFERIMKGPACSNCGTHVEGYGHTCPNCEIKVTYENQKKKKSNAEWYAISILLGFIGGLIAYASIRKENPSAARDCLLTGIVVSIIVPIIGMYFFGV
jgi:hypothetical protein